MLYKLKVIRKKVMTMRSYLMIFFYYSDKKVSTHQALYRNDNFCCGVQKQTKKYSGFKLKYPGWKPGFFLENEFYFVVYNDRFIL